MRVECESCRELAVATVAIADGIVLVTCSACDAVARVTPVVSVAIAATPGGPRCPKCGDPRRGAESCARCGRAAERRAGFAEARDRAIAEPVRAAWARVLAGWEDPRCHDAFLHEVAKHDAYAWAAGRYRDAAREHADEIGPRQLERLRRSAEVTLLASAGARPNIRPAITILVLAVAAIGGGLLYSVVTRDAGRGGSTLATPARGSVAPQQGTR